MFENDDPVRNTNNEAACAVESPSKIPMLVNCVQTTAYLIDLLLITKLYNSLKLYFNDNSEACRS